MSLTFVDDPYAYGLGELGVWRDDSQTAVLRRNKQSQLWQFVTEFSDEQFDSAELTEIATKLNELNAK